MFGEEEFFFLPKFKNLKYDNLGVFWWLRNWNYPKYHGIQILYHEVNSLLVKSMLIFSQLFFTITWFWCWSMIRRQRHETRRRKQRVLMHVLVGWEEKKQLTLRKRWWERDAGGSWSVSPYLCTVLALTSLTREQITTLQHLSMQHVLGYMKIHLQHLFITTLHTSSTIQKHVHKLKQANHDCQKLNQPKLNS